MLNLRVISDLHLDANVEGNVELPVMENESEQKLIIAGDLCPMSKQDLWKPFIEDMSERFDEVYWLFGNHEWYGEDMNNDHLTFFYIDDTPDNVTVIHDNQVIQIDDYTFFFTTFWTDMDNNNPLSKFNVGMALNDYRCIWNGIRTLITDDTVVFHNESMALLDKVKQENENVIVVSHHAPTYSSVPERYKGSSINPGFVSDNKGKTDGVKVWIHGHTHNTMSYMEDDCYIICNPHGYGNENPDFNGRLLLEV